MGIVLFDKYKWILPQQGSITLVDNVLTLSIPNNALRVVLSSPRNWTITLCALWCYKFGQKILHKSDLPSGKSTVCLTLLNIVCLCFQYCLFSPLAYLVKPSMTERLNKTCTVTICLWKIEVLSCKITTELILSVVLRFN